jgi:Domain of unknown function (DUF4403)
LKKTLIIVFIFFINFTFAQVIVNKPAVTDGKDLIFEKKPSIISIPFDLSIDDFQKKINEGMPDLIFEDKSFEDNDNDDFKVKVWRKGNLVFTEVKDNILTYEVPLKIWAQKRVSALGMSQTPATEFELKLKFSSKFTILTDYSMQTQTNGLGYTWITKPALKTGYLEIPIGPVIGKLIDNNQAMFARQIDETIKASFSLKPYMLEAWNTAKKPFQASVEYNSWVKLEPLEIYLTPLKSNGKSLKSVLGIKLFVETLVGTPTETFTPTLSLPPLKIVNSIPEVFQLQLFNIIDYKEAARITKTMFLGQKFEYKNGKYNIEITDVTIEGNNDGMLFKVDTKGSFRGTIYVKGIPQYDPVRRQVILTKTELDVKTKNVFHKTGAWLAEGIMEKKIEKDFGLPVDDIIAVVKENVLKTINSDLSKGIKIKGEIIEIVPQNVKTTENGIIAIVNAKAKVELIVKGM